MLKRRDFLKGAIGTLAILNVPVPLSWATTDEKSADSKDTGVEPMWQRTILCQFDNPALKEAVERLAKDTGCNIWYGRPGWPDIIAVPCFIAVVDRNLIGEEIWNEYLRFCEEVNDDTPCVIVDEIKHLGLPKNKDVSRFNTNDPASINAVKEIIIASREKMYGK